MNLVKDSYLTTLSFSIFDTEIHSFKTFRNFHSFKKYLWSVHIVLDSIPTAEDTEVDKRGKNPVPVDLTFYSPLVGVTSGPPS